MGEILNKIRSFIIDVILISSIVGYNLYILIGANNQIVISDYFVLGVGYILLFLYVIKCKKNKNTVTKLKKQLNCIDDELKLQTNEKIQALDNLNKELEAFTFSVSHDLNQPLRSISGFAEIIKRSHGDKLDPTVADYINRIYKSSKRMEEIIRELLRLSRITVGDVTRVNCEITPMIIDIINQLQLNYKHTVKFDVQNNMGIYADEEMIKSVFENILGNSWKYTENIENPIVKIGCLNSICIGDSNMKYAIYYVDDNGVGFDMKHADKLFEAFYKLEFKQKQYEGSGIGLSTVYRIIKKHNGDIWVESQEGEGTTIYFTFNKYM